MIHTRQLNNSYKLVLEMDKIPKSLLLFLLLSRNCYCLFFVNLNPTRRLIYRDEITSYDVSILSLTSYQITIPEAISYTVIFKNDHNEVIKLLNESLFFTANDVNTQERKNLIVQGLDLGVSHIKAFIQETMNEIVVDSFDSNVTARVEVLDSVGTADRIFVIISAVIILVHIFLAGSNLCLKPISESLKKPIALSIGLTCQFIIGPLVSFFFFCICLTYLILVSHSVLHDFTNIV